MNIGCEGSLKYRNTEQQRLVRHFNVHLPTSQVTDAGTLKSENLFPEPIILINNDFSLSEMWDILVLTVIYVPQKSPTFICLNTTLSEALLKFACNSASFEDFCVFDTEIQKAELKKPKICSYFYSAVRSGYSSSSFFCLFLHSALLGGES